MLKLDAQLLDGVSKLDKRLVLTERSKEALEVLDERRQVPLVLLVARDELLASLEEGGRSSVGSLGSDVALDLEAGLEERSDVCEEGGRRSVSSCDSLREEEAWRTNP